MNKDELEIVVVEDNPSDALLLMRIFKKHNLANNIVVLEDGAKALDFLLGGPETGATIQPRLIVLDLKLPKVDGIEVLLRLKSDERTKETPVMILTSSQEDKDLQAAYQAGANSYVTKPIDFQDFAKVVSEMQLYWLLVNQQPQRDPANTTP